MFHLTYSNHYEELAEALAEAVAHNTDPFASTTIVVPNRSVVSYLEFAIARRNGIAANLHFPFLESLLSTGLPGHLHESANDVIDRAQLHALLCSLFADTSYLEHRDLGPVRAYLRMPIDDTSNTRAADGSSAARNPHAFDARTDAEDLRRFQLAGQVARLFMEYSLSRPELIAGWSTKRPARSDESATERWQRRLWVSIFGDLSAQNAAAPGLDTHYSTLIGLLEATRPEDLRLPETIHIFGFSYLAPGYYRVFGRLAQRTNLLVYALNPCREFWEDSAGRRGHPVDEAVAEQETLRQWGRPGREHVRALNALANFDFDARFVEPGGASLLGRLQTDILDRAGAPSGDASAQVMQPDDSVRILACPSIQREIEIVGNEIWQLMKVTPDLTFNQIAVLVCPTEFAAYHAHIASVFGELHRLPHHVIDAPLESDSRVIEAFELLLELPFGNFTRPELLRVMTHPAVIGRHPEVDPAEWIDWAEQLGIVHGADHSDHANTYIDRDVFNWDQGIRRLALGAFMNAPGPGERTCAGDDSGSDDSGSDDSGASSGADSRINGNRAYRTCVPETIDEQQQPSAARFALMARSLIADARFCRQARMTLTDWRRFFTCMITGYLTPTGNSGERDLDRCRDAVAQLSALDLDGKPTSYRIASELLRSSLGELRGSRGQPLAQGVTVAPLAPMRALPFRAVFVLGLGEGRFPARDDTSPLDLRNAAPNPSDVSANERDRYSLLETLIGTRDYLRLSYVARDVQTGEALEASSVITELAEMIASYLPSTSGEGESSAADAITVHHPLRSFDQRYHPALFGAGGNESFESVSPIAYRQARALALRQDLESHLRDHGDRIPCADAARSLADPDSWPRIAECMQLRQALPDLTERSTPKTPEAIELSLSTVRAFLEDPLQAWARVLGLRSGDTDDYSGRTDEPFATDTLRRAITLREVFREALRDGVDASSLLQRCRAHFEAAELTSHVPLGLFGEIDRQGQEEILTRWYQRLDDIDALADPWTRYSFGRAPEGRAAGIMLPPIELTVPSPQKPQDSESASRLVRLHGSTQLVGCPEHGSLVLAPSTVRAKHHLTGFVDQLALAAAGEGSGRIHGVTAVGRAPGKAGLSRLSLAPWSQHEARDYLSALIGELLHAEHAYLLPCEAVFKHHKQRGDGQPSLVSIIRSSLAAADNRKQRGQGFAQGPVSRLHEVSPPSETEALAMVERRFSLFFERSEVLS